jgi:hypothetical protein
MRLKKNGSLKDIMTGVPQTTRAGGESGLRSPTSLRMKSTFILLNTNASFDSYYTLMRKRKNPKFMSSVNANHSISMSDLKDDKISIKPKKPSARDGHACCLFQNKMFIFGGDRHHMTFNDLYFLTIA